jgi:cysteinyl-tRNA synthetase
MIKFRSIERIDASPGEKRAIFEALDLLLGLDLLSERQARPLPDDAIELLNKRAQARLNKDFATSDYLRDQLFDLGISVQDTATGQEWNWSVNS